MQPLESCRNVCLVTVSVPADSTVAFQLWQSALAEGGTTNYPLVRVRQGAVLASLALGAWWKCIRPDARTP